MIYAVGATLVIPLLVVDTSGSPITGTSAVCTIWRSSDDTYWNGTTWQSISYDNSMIHKFKGTYVYTFIPSQEDFYIIRASCSTYKVEGGFAFRAIEDLNNISSILGHTGDLNIRLTDSRALKIDNLDTIPTIDSNVDSIITKLDTNLDTTVSSRLASADYISMSGEDIETIEGKVDLINSKLDEHLDVAVSTRSSVTEESIWGHSVRTLSPTNSDGVGEFSLTITCSVDGVVTEGISVFVYDDNRVAINQATTDSNGQVIFWLDAGDFYVDFQKENCWSKEIEQTISVDTVISEDLESINDDDNLIVEFRELNSNIILENGNSATIGIEAYGNGTFSVSSATATITGIESAVNCSISGKRIYVTFVCAVMGWVTVKFNVNINSNSYPYEKRYYVD